MNAIVASGLPGTSDASRLNVAARSLPAGSPSTREAVAISVSAWLENSSLVRTPFESGSLNVILAQAFSFAGPAVETETSVKPSRAVKALMAASTVAQTSIAGAAPAGTTREKAVAGNGAPPLVSSRNVRVEESAKSMPSAPPSIEAIPASKSSGWST